jgi:hypothetical protein
MITFVTWKWPNPNSAKRCFESAHVNVLRAWPGRQRIQFRPGTKFEEARQ